jgi:hypothetical protein
VMERDGNLDGAAAELGARGLPRLTRQAINKWARNGSPEATALRARLDAAGARLPPEVESAPKAPARESRSLSSLAAALRPPRPSIGMDEPLTPKLGVLDLDNLPGLSPHDLVLEVERIALDPEHRGSGKALDIICKLKLGRAVRAQQRLEAHLDALASAESVVSQDEGAAIIELPVNDTEAPGRAPRPVETGVLEAEVVDHG